MAALTIQDVVLGGLAPSYSAVALADTMKVNAQEERHFLHVKNGSGVSVNVTITAVKTSVNVKGVGDLVVADKVIAVGAGADKMIGPFPEAYIETDGNVAIAYSAITSVTAAALKLPAV